MYVCCKVWGSRPELVSKPQAVKWPPPTSAWPQLSAQPGKSSHPPRLLEIGGHETGSEYLHLTSCSSAAAWRSLRKICSELCGAPLDFLPASRIN